MRRFDVAGLLLVLAALALIILLASIFFGHWLLDKPVNVSIREPRPNYTTLGPPELPTGAEQEKVRVFARTEASRAQEGVLPGVWRRLKVTAYPNGKAYTGKSPGQKGYRITASGTKTQQWRTAAMNKVPMGTKIYIPELKDKPNRGVFVVEDRIGGGTDLDIFMDSVEECRKFGRRELDVLILEGER